MNKAHFWINNRIPKWAAEYKRVGIVRVRIPCISYRRKCLLFPAIYVVMKNSLSIHAVMRSSVSSNWRNHSLLLFNHDMSRTMKGKLCCWSQLEKGVFDFFSDLFRIDYNNSNNPVTIRTPKALLLIDYQTFCCFEMPHFVSIGRSIGTSFVTWKVCFCWSSLLWYCYICSSITVSIYLLLVSLFTLIAV